MVHAIARIVVASLVAVMASSTVLAAPAGAADEDLGWFRLTPAQGSLDDAIDGLTQAPCPAGEAIVVGLTGPGIPTGGDIGYIVGNTALSALPPTESGQLYVPLNLTLRDWFARNAPGLAPAGTYRVVLTCRAALRGSVTYGTFSADVAIAKAGTYRALGEAAKPFNTGQAPVDPLAGVTEAPSPAASAGAPTPPQPTPSGAVSQTAPGEAPGAVTDGSSPSGAASPRADAATQVTDSGSSARLLLLALGVLLVAAAAFAALRRRPAPTASATPEPADQPVDVH